MIEGRVVHKTSNALKITFSDGPGEPLAVGVQGAGDGAGGKLAMLFGFKNGGTGKHRITYSDGAIVWVESKAKEPTVITHGDGTPLATVERGDASSAVSSTGGTLFRFVPDPDEARTPEVFRILVQDAQGEDVGRLDVIRSAGGWTLKSIADDLYNTYIWWDHAGGPLPVPLLGTRLMLRTPVEGAARDVLLGACVDIALGLRPYTEAMR